MYSVTSLSATTLRELAAAKEWHTPTAKARRDLSLESVDELALMLMAGKYPTVGWWRRQRLTASNHADEIANHYFDTGITADYWSRASSVSTIPSMSVEPRKLTNR
jgi:hypothetical protein